MAGDDHIESGLGKSCQYPCTATWLNAMFVSPIPVSRLSFSLSLSLSFFSLSLSMSWSENRVFELLRLRAAVFVNLVTMRKVMDHGGNGHVQLAPCNLEILQKSNYLFHSAHNCPLTLICHTCVFVVGLLLLQQ